MPGSVGAAGGQPPAATRPIAQFRDVAVSETRDLDENTLLDIDIDIDDDGNICAITLEHASKRAGIPRFSYEQVAA